MSYSGRHNLKYVDPPRSKSTDEIVSCFYCGSDVLISNHNCKNCGGVTSKRKISKSSGNVNYSTGSTGTGYGGPR